MTALDPMGTREKSELLSVNEAIHDAREYMRAFRFGPYMPPSRLRWSAYISRLESELQVHLWEPNAVRGHSP